jgi:hypothetical protein
MVGAGLNVFAVWNYIVTKTHFGMIELNPKLLRAILGGELEDIEGAIKYLSEPDAESRSKDEGGRRIVKEGQFLYRVVNWEAYQTIRDEEGLREYNRRKQAEYRAREKAKMEGMGEEERRQYLAEKSAKRSVVGGGRGRRGKGSSTGLSAREMVAKAVREDPVTIADAAEVRRKWGKADGSEAEAGSVSALDGAAGGNGSGEVISLGHAGAAAEDE